MLETIALYVVLVAAPLALLAAAWVWSLRAGQVLTPRRRIPFLCGLTAASVAYAAQFILHWYLVRAHLGFWPEAHVILDVGQAMLIAALGGFATSWFGRGYGRISSCSASVLVFVTWWFIGMAAV